MDTNKLLAEMRALLASIDNPDKGKLTRARIVDVLSEHADSFKALDLCLSNGGDLPAAWRAAR